MTYKQPCMVLEAVRVCLRVQWQWCQNIKPSYDMTDCKKLLVALAQSIDDPQIGIFNLYSEEDCGNSIEEQVKMFFGVKGIIGLEPGQYLYSYELEYHGDGWAFDATISDDYDSKIYLYKIGNNE